MKRSEADLSLGKIQNPNRSESGERNKQEEVPVGIRLGFNESEHPAVDKYWPVFLGKGGEHLVYDLVGRPDIVVKANKKVMYDTLIADPTSYMQDTVEGSAALKDAKLQLEHDKRIQAKLREHFGSKHLLPQRKFLTKVPVTEPILDEISVQFDKDLRNIGAMPYEAREAWTLVTVQRKQDLPEGDIECPKGSNTEFNYLDEKWYANDVKRRQYAIVTDALLRGDPHMVHQQGFLNLTNTPELRHLAEHMKADEGLREAVKDFVTRAIAFAEDTGEILDVVGKNNIVFLQEGGRWTYKLIDPLYPFDSRVLEKARKVYAEGKPRAGMTSAESNAFIQGVMFTRMINGLALLSDAPTLKFLPRALMTGSIADRIFPAPQKQAA